VSVPASSIVAPRSIPIGRLAEVSGIGPPGEPRRYLSIDILRAIAILLMIQVHFVEDFALHISKDFASPTQVYDLSGALGLVPAPIFTFLVGLSYSLWLAVQQQSGRSEDQIARRSFRRGMFVFVLGFAVNVLIQMPDQTFNWDILTLLGAASLIITWVRNWHPGALAALCIVIVLAAPPLRDLSQYESHWVDDAFQIDTELKDIVLGFAANGYFPLFPWLAYALAGFALGQAFYPRDSEGDASLPIFLVLLGVALVGLALLGVAIEPHVPEWMSRYYANEWPDDFYPASTVFVLFSLGTIIACLWPFNLMFDCGQWAARDGRVVAFFQRYSRFALTAYVAHLAAHLWPIWIALALWPKPSVEAFLGSHANAWTSLGLATGFIGLFYCVAIWLERHRKWSIEYFLRWCCE
jgi:uncharacterized membrane protein